MTKFESPAAKPWVRCVIIPKNRTRHCLYRVLGTERILLSAERQGGMGWKALFAFLERAEVMRECKMCLTAIATVRVRNHSINYPLMLWFLYFIVGYGKLNYQDAQIIQAVEYSLFGILGFNQAKISGKK